MGRNCGRCASERRRVSVCLHTETMTAARQTHVCKGLHHDAAWCARQPTHGDLIGAACCSLKVNKRAKPHGRCPAEHRQEQVRPPDLCKKASHPHAARHSRFSVQSASAALLVSKTAGACHPQLSATTPTACSRVMVTSAPYYIATA